MSGTADRAYLGNSGGFPTPTNTLTDGWSALLSGVSLVMSAMSVTFLFAIVREAAQIGQQVQRKFREQSHLRGCRLGLTVYSKGHSWMQF